MHSIRDVFRASASSVYDTFNLQMGVASFRVPVYQRQYTWHEANINRLFEDINEGLMALGSDQDYLTFLGTIVLVDEGDKKEQYFDGQSLSIVDGQQRLSTLALMCCALFAELTKASILSSHSSPLSVALQEEVRALCDSLFSCAVGHPSSHRPLERYDYFPRLVREEVDIRSASPQEASYVSPIANRLFRFADFARSDHLHSLPVDASSSDSAQFGSRVATIVKGVTDVGKESVDTESVPDYPPTIELFENEKYRSVLFPRLQQRTDRIKEVMQNVRGDGHGDLRTLVKLVAFGNYLMQRVAITHVIAGDERYAFDIFEALNSTGEPLTAIETFKPNVIRFENRQSTSYEVSPSKESLDVVEGHVRRLDKYEDQQSESRELVVLFALYVTGERLGLQLNSQRRYLRTTYEKLGDAAKRRFVGALAEVVEYRSKFWDIEELANQYRDAENKEVGLFCLRFIRDLRNSLTIPILCRYWVESERRGDATVFFGAVKAVTAFVVLRRAATGGTRAIDSDYRRIMLHGGMTKRDGADPLKGGTEREEAELPDLDVLRRCLRGYLRQSKVGISGKGEWLRRVSQQPLYRSGPAALCRFMLIVAAHHAIPDGDHAFLLTRGRASQERDYINLHSWQRDDFSTLEHVAPQRRNDGWDDSLYQDDNLVDYLGNLTLLPEKMNASIGNKPWSKKRLFYRAAAAESVDGVRDSVEIARKEGLDFGSKIVTMLESGQCLPILSSVSAATQWDADVVRRRTENIAALVWDLMASWLAWNGE